jgi:AcrR family transcriptional regulator
VGAEIPFGPPVRERADAARNRARVLEAAAQVFAERGVADVTMDDVAAAAGVGKGTLYRRFRDKSGLAAALLGEAEKDLQQLILSGPAPLGPGAPPTDRLVAFAVAYLELVDRQLDLVMMSETATPGARLRTGVHRFWHRHCEYLLQESGAPDPAVRAGMLLSSLAAEQVGAWLREQERPPAEVRAALTAAVRALARPAG